MGAGMNRHLMTGFLATAAVLLAAAGAFLWAADGVHGSVTQSVSTLESAPVIVIDPGHGGEDGGAVGADGTLEKDLNLSVAETLAELLRTAGFDVRMTRTDDRMLYDLYGDQTEYSGKKKTFDLKNRLRFAREENAALFVSVHMNLFPQPQYSGLQVYYAKTEGSRAAADAVQSYARQYLQPQNTRQTKQASSSIYLLHRADRPAILIECGFLSNEAELSHLRDETYRRQLALVIACAISAGFET